MDWEQLWQYINIFWGHLNYRSNIRFFFSRPENSFVPSPARCSTQIRTANAVAQPTFLKMNSRHSTRLICIRIKRRLGPARAERTRTSDAFVTVTFPVSSISHKKSIRPHPITDCGASGTGERGGGGSGRGGLFFARDLLGSRLALLLFSH